MGGFSTGYPEIKFIKKNDRIISEYSTSFSTDVTTREIPEKEWKCLLKTLYCKLYLHGWKHTYKDPGFMDGEQWELNIRLTHGRQRNYQGSNSFPAYWEELQVLFEPYLEICLIIFNTKWDGEFPAALPYRN